MHVYLPCIVPGNLSSWPVLACRDLQLWGTSDPYATFSIGMSHARSQVVDRNLDPEWDEEFTLYVR